MFLSKQKPPKFSVKRKGPDRTKLDNSKYYVLIFMYRNYIIVLMILRNTKVRKPIYINSTFPRKFDYISRVFRLISLVQT